MSVDATRAADLFLHQRLSASAELVGLLGGSHVYSYLAPQTVEFPVVVFSPVSVVDHNAVASRALSEATYQVACITQDYSQVSGWALAEAVDHSLQGAWGTVQPAPGTAVVHGVMRQSVSSDRDAALGTGVSVVSAVYRLWVEDARS